MDMGAVGGIRNIRDASRAAQLVKDHTHHSILIGGQATQFAVDMGLQYSSLATAASTNINNRWRSNDCQPNFRKAVKHGGSCGPYEAAPQRANIDDNPAHRRSTELQGQPEEPQRRLASAQSEHGTGQSASELGNHNPRRNRRCGLRPAWAGPGAHDTIALLAIDAAQNVAAGTSTNGNCGKVPGRVGDAAVPGAGGYAVTGVGACGATGDGDVMMRFLPCYQARFLSGF